MWPLADSADSSVNASLRPLPSLTRQAAFFATGALAGTSAVPIEVLYQRFASSAKHHHVALRYLAPPIIYRAGVRFWSFDLAKSQFEHTSTPTWLRGGISGAVGGFVEVLAQSVIQRKTPDPTAVGDQTAKLFLCFGAYTYLSKTLSPEQSPPKPFWYCWTLGAAAGGAGSAVMSTIHRARSKALLGNSFKGACIIGTVIAVQVTSCADVLERIE